MRKYSKITAVSFFLFSSFAWGQSYQLGTATFSGNGCPSGSAAVSVSPDGSAISFLFDRFSAQTVGNHMAGAVSCVVQIPLTVTSGYVVDATYLDFRGFAALPVRSYLQILGSGVLNKGLSKFSTSSSVPGPSTGNFSLRQRISNPTKQKCPEAHMINLTITAILNSRQDAQFTLDSADIGTDGAVLGIALKPCRL
jgi:hypothetical protein